MADNGKTCGALNDLSPLWVCLENGASDKRGLLYLVEIAYSVQPQQSHEFSTRRLIKKYCPLFLQYMHRRNPTETFTEQKNHKISKTRARAEYFTRICYQVTDYNTVISS